MNIFFKTFFLVFAFFLILLCFPVEIFATQISFDAKGNQFTEGEEFIISVQVDTEEQSINAIEGSINFPSDLVVIKEIQDGDSVINIWLERPHASNSGIIKFAGITPGGFSGVHNTLFSVVLRATGIGNGIIYGTSLQSLSNDGMGTDIQIKNESLPIIISQSTSDSLKSNMVFQDKELPESFTPVVTSDPEVFNGKYFLVFATQDKSSGIDYYKVKEGQFGFFTEAESSYLLRNQNLDQKIYVKAVDKAGNERIEVLEAQNKHNTLYQNYIIFGIIVIVVIGILFAKKVWLKYIR